MQAFLDAVIALPTILFTLPLALSLFYWLLVIVGAADVDALGAGVGAEGALEGVDGVLDGAEGVLDGAEGTLDGAAHVHDGFEGFSLLTSLGLRSAPLTVVISLFSFFGWIVSLFGFRFLQDALPASFPVLATVVGTFGLASVVSFFLTRLAIKPMASLFVHNPVRGHDALVGQTCIVRSGTVSEKSGQAEVDNGAAGLLLNVRSEGTGLKNGDEAVIISYAKKNDVYLIEPMPVFTAGLLGDGTTEQKVPAAAPATEITTSKSEMS